MLAYALNFYCFIALRSDAFSETILKTLLALCLVMSLGIIAMPDSVRMVFVFFPNKNLLCSFLNCGLLAIMAEWHRTRGRETGLSKKNLAWDIFYFSSLCIIVLAELRNYSLGAIIALISGVLIYSRLNKIKIWIPCAVGIILILSGSLVFPQLALGLLQKLTLLSENFRVQIWQTSWQAFLAKPLAGWGLGNFEIAYQIHKLPIDTLAGRYEKVTTFAHNEALQIAVEMGVLGLTGIAFMAYAMMQSVRTFFRNTDSNRIHHWAFSCAAMLGVHSVFDFNLHLPMLGFLFFFFCSHIILTQESREASKWVRVTASITLIFIFAAHFATQAYKKVLRKTLNSASVQMDKGKILMTASAIDPTNHQSHADLARHYFEENRFAESQEEYGKAIAWSPKNPFYQAEAGDVCLRQNRPDLARSYYVRAVELEPFYAFAHYRLGEIDVVLGNLAEAKAAFENVIRIREANLTAESEYCRRLLDFDVNLARARLNQISG